MKMDTVDSYTSARLVKVERASSRDFLREEFELLNSLSLAAKYFLMAASFPGLKTRERVTRFLKSSVLMICSVDWLLRFVNSAVNLEMA